jgi:hypothetical protein
MRSVTMLQTKLMGLANLLSTYRQHTHHIDFLWIIDARERQHVYGYVVLPFDFVNL